MIDIGKNLRSQFIYAINSSFKENINKHSIKSGTNDMVAVVFSYSEKKNLCNLASNFCGFIKENFSEIRLIKDIRSEHVQAFLEAKKGDCTQNTLNIYKTQLKKLGELSNAVYKTHVDLTKDVIVPKAVSKADQDRGSANQMPRGVLNAVLSYAIENRSQSGDVVRLAAVLGCRVNEIIRLKVSDLDLQKSELTISNTKGGKEMTIKLTQELKSLIYDIKSQNYTRDNRLFNIKADSVNKWLSRHAGTEYSIHSIRRTVAQEYYDRLRAEGKGIHEAVRQTSLVLNHNSERYEMMIRSYINIH